MALANLTPRQKMINMMYLVLMALLALNVSKEVLQAFGSINESITETTHQLTKSSEFIYADLKNKYENNPEKYTEIYNNATTVVNESNKLVKFLDGVSEKLLEDHKDVLDETGELPWDSMDKDVGEIFFPGGDPKLGVGQELQDNISAFRELILSLPVSKEIHNRAAKTFNTEDVVHKDGIRVQWVKEKFEHYPQAATIAFISQIKADVRNIQSNVLSSLLNEGLGEQIVVNRMEALPIAKSNVIIRGTEFEANIKLAAYDSTLTPEIFLYKYDSKGNELANSEYQVKNDGSGLVKLAANSIGSFFYGGFMRVKDDEGGYKDYPFKGKYSVNEPAAVISADKMNVLYRGVKNPISVSVPGVDPNKVRLNGPGLTKDRPGHYLCDVTNVNGKETKFSVSATMEDGTVQNFPALTYRIKNIPKPEGRIAKLSKLALPSDNLVNLPVEVILPDFDFELKLVVTGFELSIPGVPPFRIDGDKIRNNSRAAKRVKTLKAGTSVTIRNISVKLQGSSSYQVKDATEINVTLQ